MHFARLLPATLVLLVSGHDSYLGAVDSLHISHTEASPVFKVSEQLASHTSAVLMMTSPRTLELETSDVSHFRYVIYGI